MMEVEDILDRYKKWGLSEVQTLAYDESLSPCFFRLANLPVYLTQAILLEVCTHPKPGLVTRSSCGAHCDMSIITFAMSSAVLAQAFKDLHTIGFFHQAGTMKDLFHKVRCYGVNAEQKLLEVTKQVNTQRGILFVGGLLAAAGGYLLGQHLRDCQSNKVKVYDRHFNIDILPVLAKFISEMTEGLVREELVQNQKKNDLSIGERLYRKFGITGIRGEVEAGLPSVITKGLPALQEALRKGSSINDGLVHTLISLMTVVEDSNVIWRSDIVTAEHVKREAVGILEKGSIFTEEGQRALKDIEKQFIEKRISPGGSADLLSITIALYLLDAGNFPKAII